jgi:ABC-2 type transport system permease protein
VSPPTSKTQFRVCNAEKSGAFVQLPPNFYRDVLRGTPTGGTVMGNGGYIVVDGAVLETTAKVVAAAAAPALAAQLVRANVPPAAVMRIAHSNPAFIKQPLFNTVQGYDSYVVPASMGLIVHQLLIIGICLVIGTWIEGGRWAIATNGPPFARQFCRHAGGFLGPRLHGDPVLDRLCISGTTTCREPRTLREQ